MNIEATQQDAPKTSHVRVLLCNPGLDGHDRGIKVVARALRDAGMEVIYLPLRTTVEEAVRVAVQEDADVIGIGNLSATLVSTCRRVVMLLGQEGANDVLVVCGGTVLADDRRELANMGIEGVFGPGTRRDDIVRFIRDHVPVGRRTRLVGS